MSVYLKFIDIVMKKHHWKEAICHLLLCNPSLSDYSWGKSSFYYCIFIENIKGNSEAYCAGHFHGDVECLFFNVRDSIYKYGF